VGPSRGTRFFPRLRGFLFFFFSFLARRLFPAASHRKTFCRPAGPPPPLDSFDTVQHLGDRHFFFSPLSPQAVLARFLFWCKGTFLCAHARFFFFPHKLGDPKGRSPVLSFFFFFPGEQATND